MRKLPLKQKFAALCKAYCDDLTPEKGLFMPWVEERMRKKTEATEWCFSYV